MEFLEQGIEGRKPLDAPASTTGEAMIWAEIALWLICGACIAVGAYRFLGIVREAMEAQRIRNER